MFKDWLIKTIFSLLTLTYMWYVVYLTSQGFSFVIPTLFNYFFVVAIVLIIYMIMIALHASRFQYHLTTRLKIFFVAMSILLILSAHYILIDDPSRYIYLKDISMIYAIWIMIAGVSGLSISSETVKKLEDQKIEIIEV